jgi:cysteine-rich repeat protein
MASASGCGDGRVEPGEECDDGNLANGDGCTWGCLVESGHDCFEASGRSYCGSPIRALGESLTFGATRRELLSYVTEYGSWDAMCTGGSTWLINRMDHIVRVRPAGARTALGHGDFPGHFFRRMYIDVAPGEAVRAFDCEWYESYDVLQRLPTYTRDGPPEEIDFVVDVVLP